MIYTSVCVCMCVCVQMWQLEVNDECLHISLLYILRQALSLNLQLSYLEN